MKKNKLSIKKELMQEIKKANGIRQDNNFYTVILQYI